MTERARLDLMRDTCEALWGSRWQTELCRLLGCNPATIQRWLAGKGGPRAQVSGKLYWVVEERIARLQALSNELRRDTPLD